MKRVLLLALAFILILPLASIDAQESNPVVCVEDYQAGVDYFPAKAEVEYATGFEVEYFDNYKVVTVTTPWLGATEDDAFTYVLVQCGTPAPEGFDDAQVIEIPGDSVIALSTTQLPHLVELGLLDHLVGLDSFLYAYSPEVREMIAADQVVEVGTGPSVNIEVVLDMEPDLVMAYGSGIPDYDPYPVLLENDLPTVINAEWIEASPLARAEWIKFTALFFNAEAAANDYFDTIEAEYNGLVELAAEIEAKPTVLTGVYFGDSWAIAGTESYIGQLIRDAGAEQAFADHPDVDGTTATALFDFEAIYLDGLEADYWLPSAFGVSTADDLLALDERYADFVAFENGNVFNVSARVNENGGNDFYESGVVNPQVVLADLIAIFHPDLLPDHELVYFEQLD